MEAVQTSEIRWYKGRPGSGTAATDVTLVKLSIDGKDVKAPAGVSLLSAASAAGIYIPALCAHPDLPPSAQRGGGSSGCNDKKWLESQSFIFKYLSFQCMAIHSIKSIQGDGAYLRFCKTCYPDGLMDTVMNLIRQIET